MRYSIGDERLYIEADTLGGELSSIKKDGIEFLWQGDPKYWMGRAYNLFPICGRLYEGVYTYDGETYEMGIHGFVRHSEMALTEHTDNRMTFTLTDNEETRRQYPFSFSFSVTYQIVNGSLAVIYDVENRDGKDLPFSVGGHPGFNVPLDGSFEDWYLEFDEECEPHALVFGPTCFCRGLTAYPLDDKKRIPLHHDLFDDDAIFLTGVPAGVTLKSDVSEHSVRVVYPDMTYLGLWHKPKTDAPYLCIEPWHGTPSDDGRIDDFSTKKDMLTLAPGKTYRNAFIITVQ